MGTKEREILIEAGDRFVESIEDEDSPVKGRPRDRPEACRYIRKLRSRKLRALG
jgi:hypothetical protein